MNATSVGQRVTGYVGRVIQRLDRPDEREFLPAALEVLETPPSPLGRGLAFLIMAFFLIAVAWAFLGKVDVLATAPGRVIPAGEVKVIQPLDSGTVRAIHVQDGDHVRAGQLLIELDPTQAQADRDKLARDLTQAKLDVARLTALKGAIAAGRPHFVPPPDASTDEASQARAATEAQYDQQASKVADLTQQIDERSAELAEVQAEAAKTNASMPLLEEKDQIYETLKQKGFGTRLAAIEAAEELSNARHDLDVDAQRATAARAAQSALEQERDGARSEYEVGVLGDLAKAQEQQNELSQELLKAQDRSAQTELRAPIDGVIDQLAIHTLNGVVTPAEHLMIVVPDTRNLTVEARLANRDVGFVHAGQSVKVKVETFNFTRYGLIDGTVTGVSRDVVAAPLADNGAAASAAAAPQAGSPAYVARIALKRTDMMIDGKLEPLVPGMSITAEIKTGERTIIDYLLSPLARKTQESLHER